MVITVHSKYLRISATKNFFPTHPVEFKRKIG